MNIRSIATEFINRVRRVNKPSKKHETGDSPKKDPGDETGQGPLPKDRRHLPGHVGNNFDEPA